MNRVAGGILRANLRILSGPLQIISEYDIIAFVKNDDLIRENEILRKRLALAESWMRREVLAQRTFIGEGLSRKDTRKKLTNLLETESNELIMKRIQGYFFHNLIGAPAFTKERLFDAEIYWQTLQKYPTLDALPIVTAYQKILDAFFLENISRGFIDSYRHVTIRHIPIPGLDSDISNMLGKGYILSLGRWYQLFLILRQNHLIRGEYIKLLASYIHSSSCGFHTICLSDAFFTRFEILIEREVFGKKRHDSKITYRDAQLTREIMVGNYEKDGLLRILFLGTS